MGRIYFARGCRGAIARKLQIGLAASGYYTGRIDGIFGGGTERAVLALQTDRGLARSGAVDGPTWTAATATPLPALADRCLQLTAAFEGHGFSIVRGNFDGAWLTWGIIGFTLKHGGVRKIVLEAWEQDPGTVRGAFGDRTAELISLMSRNDAAELEAWANRISVGRSRATVTEPWRSGFMSLGESPLVQQIQVRLADEDYFAHCLLTADRYRLGTELGIALCFDIHVQNGGVKAAAHARFVKAVGADFAAKSEPERRMALAVAVADSAKKEWRDDVRARKLILAVGAGTVHHEAFRLESWGLGEYPG